MKNASQMASLKFVPQKRYKLYEHIFSFMWLSYFKFLKYEMQWNRHLLGSTDNIRLKRDRNHFRYFLSLIDDFWEQETTALKRILIIGLSQTMCCILLQRACQTVSRTNFEENGMTRFSKQCYAGDRNCPSLKQIRVIKVFEIIKEV